MKDQHGYWEKQIIEWENISYNLPSTQKVSFIERLAQPFRGPVRYRPVLAFEIIKDLKPKRVLELGCGSGRFAASIITKAGVQKVTGVDTSSEAIRIAQRNAQSTGLTHQLTFMCSNVGDLDFKALGSFDYVVGLGLTPYLTEAEFTHLFTSIKNVPFFFDLHNKGVSVQNVLHAGYRTIKGHPFYHCYSRREILQKLSDLGLSNITWKESNGVFYIQH